MPADNSPPAALTPVVAYARQSADLKRDEHGVDDQHGINDATAEKHGCRIVHYFTDNDLSAAQADIVRPDFEEMLKVIKAGRLPDGKRVEGVIVSVEDRLVRRVGDYERFVDALTHEEGRFYADCRGPKNLYNEDVESMGLFGVVISKSEVRKIKRRTRNSHRSRAERGIPVGGTRPFGWNDDKRTLCENEAKWTRRAIRQVLAGKSLSSILVEWLNAGIVTSLGNPFTLRSLKLVLWNPRICGWRKRNGELVRDAQGEPVVGKWETLATPEEWMAIDKLFTSRQGAPGGKSEPSHLLTGILRCGCVDKDGNMCNARLRASPRKGVSGGYLYLCPSRTQGGCGRLGRNGLQVDRYIKEAVLAKLEERQAVQKQVDLEWPEKGEYERLKEKHRTLVENWRIDRVSDELFYTENEKMEAELRKLRRKEQAHASKVERQVPLEGDIRERWESKDFDLSQKRALIKEALYAVTVLPVGGGGRRPFNPDLLVPKWKE